MGSSLAWCIAHERSWEIVPGVSSLTARGRRGPRALAFRGSSRSVVLTVPGRTAASSMRESVAGFAALGATMAIFLSAARPAELQAGLLTASSAYRPETPAVVVVRASWPDERVVPTTVGQLAQAVADSGATTTALVLVGDVFADGLLLAQPPLPPGLHARFPPAVGSRLDRRAPLAAHADRCRARPPSNLR